MWKDRNNKRNNNIDESINELLDAWMDVLSINMPSSNMSDWVEMPSKSKKANPMSYEDRDKDIVFTIDMPGVAKKDIDISIEDHSIKVTAENGRGKRKRNEGEYKMKQIGTVKRIDQYERVYVPKQIMEALGLEKESGHCVWVETEHGFMLKKATVEIEE
jgi:HSP20 family molecular chaperone IbpA